MSDSSITEAVKYKECYVAFLDILGFKKLIDKSECEDIFKIFHAVLNFEPHPLVSNSEVYNNIRYTIMSDSIVVYIEVEIEDSFIALADVCSQIQMKLSRNNPPIFLRGGISQGTLYHKERILFGTGLTKAYILENTAAIYPRIIFTEELRKKALENTRKLFVFDYNSMYYEKDDDGFYYINFLHTFNYTKTLAPKNIEEIRQMDIDYFSSLLGHIQEVLGKEIDSSISKKYLWLENKVKKQIKRMPHVETYFEELYAKEKEAADIRLNDVLKSEN